MPMRFLQGRASISSQLAAAVVLAAAIMHLYLIFLAADSHHRFAWGTPVLSPWLRAGTLVLAAALILQRARTVPRDPLIWIMAAYLVAGSLIGALNGNAFQPLARHAFAATFMLSLYWAGTLLATEPLRLQRFLRIVAWATLASLSTALALAGPDLLANPYASLSPQSAILPLSAGLASGSIALTVGSLFFILVGNKRSVVVGMCIAFGAWAALRARTATLGRRIAIFAAVAVCTASGYFVFMDSFEKIANSTWGQQNTGEVTAIFDRLERSQGIMTDQIRMPDGLTSEGRLTILTSARDLEFRAVFKEIRESQIGSVVGAGFGAHYTFMYTSFATGDQTQIRHLQPDMAISYFLLTGGILFTLLIGAAMVAGAWTIFLHAVDDPDIRMIVIYIIAWAGDNFFSVVPNTPLFWMVFGYAVQRARSARKATRSKGSPRSLRGDVRGEEDDRLVPRGS